MKNVDRSTKIEDQNSAGNCRSLAVSILLLSLAALATLPLLTPTRDTSAAPLQIVSQGVELTGAGAWHDAGIRGAGVKIGILDAGFQDYETRIEQNELPADVITHTLRTPTQGGFSGGGKHGTVMAEIAFDMAPDAQFCLVNTLPSDVDQFIQAVDWLMEQEVDVILYSRNWLIGSSGDGRGPLTAKIDETADQGILWINSAGDAARRHWQGVWEDLDGCPEAIDPAGTGSCLNFAPNDDWNDIAAVDAEQLLAVGLTWADRWEQNAEVDYNLALSFQKRSTSWLSSNDPGVLNYPVESIVETVPDAGTYNVVVSRPPDETQTRQIELFLGWDIDLEFEYQVAEGSIMTPADAQGALVVGAVHWSNDRLEAFSSRGPANDGRIKPDLVAPDGVDTVTYWLSDGTPCDAGGSGACGTGPAAAHAAGAAALVKSAFPTYSVAEIAAFLHNQARDLGSTEPDNDFGWGQLQLGPAPGQATPTATDVPPTMTLTPTATTPPDATATPTSTISPSATPSNTPEAEPLGHTVFLPLILKE